MGTKVAFEGAEREEMKSWGKSLSVENVQEMVRKDPSTVPERYIRNKEETPNDADLSPLSSEIPVIDLSALSNGDRDELRKLDVACKDWGFFQVNISLLMGMDKDRLLKLHIEVMQALRVNYYPTCCRPDQVLGVSSHSDSSTITILLQDDEVSGLQIRHEGLWVPVEPVPNALVVNVGDALEIWSNGKYKSVEHRAVTNKNKARISFASFICPCDDVEIEPFDLEVDREQDHKMYKKVRYGDYLRYTLTRQMEGKTHTQYAKFEEV